MASRAPDEQWRQQALAGRGESTQGRLSGGGSLLEGIRLKKAAKLVRQKECRPHDIGPVQEKPAGQRRGFPGMPS